MKLILSAIALSSFTSFVAGDRQACSTKATEERVVINNAVYACPGIISNGGTLGREAASLCTGDYEICPSAKRTRALGLTAAICSTKVAKNKEEFFATKETSRGWLQCHSDYPGQKNYDHDKNGIADVNDLFGCSSADPVGGRLYKTNCGGSLTTAIGNGNWKNWQYTGNGRGYDEGTNFRLNSAANGGVLCCRKEEVPQACSTKATEQRAVIKNAIYACPGIISNGGTLGKEAASLCSGDYEICPSAKRTRALGLTAAICSTKVAKNKEEFFATKETSRGWLQCHSDYPGQKNYDHDKNGVADVNDLFGCSSADPVGGRLYKTNCGGSLTTAIGNGNWKNWQYTGNGRGYDEGTNFRLNSAANGGVLCCKKEGISAYSEGLSLDYNSYLNPSYIPSAESSEWTLNLTASDLLIIALIMVNILTVMIAAYCCLTRQSKKTVVYKTVNMTDDEQTDMA